MKELFFKQAKKKKRPVILLEGTRNVPTTDAPRLHALARLLANELPSAVFRSGNAQGADSLFFQGLAAENPERLEYILPYSNMGKKRIPPQASIFTLEELSQAELEAVVEVTLTASPELESLVRAFLARGRNRVTVKAMYLLRDALKVAGAASLSLPPADFGFFFVNPENPRGGGTGHTIRTCRALKVPVFTQDEWEKWIRGQTHGKCIAS